MEEAKLAALIRPLETFAARNPALYRLRVALLAVLGYAYLLTVVLIMLGVVVGTLFYASFNWITLKILWIPLALAGLVLRSLWITIPEPDGKRLEREQAPALFDLVDEVTTALSGPKIDHVILSEDFNAAIVQIPVFGMFGWLRNYLVVGLPLLRALSPTEFRSVLAHEVGHLSGKHGRFSGWIYRVRRSWVEILTTVHAERSYASFLFEPFLKWYAPYLNAYSFVLARAQERHADQYSVDLAGKEVTAVTLARVKAKDRVLSETFWPNFFRQSKDQPKAPSDPFVQMLGGLDQPIGAVNAQKWFYEALAVPTGYEDTHPALSDRLEALGFAKNSQELTGVLGALIEADEKAESAESHYIKELPEDFLPWLNRLWRERIAPSWRESHENIKQAQKRFDQLEEQASTRALTIEEQWERVLLLRMIKDHAATLPALDAILEERPDHVGAHLAKGSTLLEQKNAEGIQHLEKAMQLDPQTTGIGSVLLSGFYFEQGDKQLAEAFRKRAAEYEERQRREHEEAVTFSNDDRFIEHGLDEKAVKDLQAQLSRVHGLEEAFLVRKVLGSSDSKVYVLAAFAGFTWSQGQNAKHLGPLFNELAALSGLPEPLVLLSLDTNIQALPKIQAIAGAKVFPPAPARVN